jgi:hypothetical protein
MNHGEINPRYYRYYEKAHAERALALRDALAWLLRGARRSRPALGALKPAPRLT